MDDLYLIVYCHIQWHSNYCKEFYYSLAKSLDGEGQVVCVDRPLAAVPDIVLRPAKFFGSIYRGRITKITANLTLFQPIIFVHDQLALYLRMFANLNRWIMKRQMRRRFDASLADSRLFSYIIEPHQYDYIKIFSNEVSIYDCIAEWASYPGLSAGEQKNVNLLENKTVQAVDVVFAVSQELYARRRKVKESVFYLPWAAEYDHFTRAADNARCPDLLNLRKPFVGFIGNIWGIFDIDLIESIAKSLPECSVILMGGLSERLPSGYKKRFDEICNLDNVHWLGYKDHSVLPDYLHHLEVCLMPYVVDDWIKTCSPGKFYQYLAQGKPVVSVDIPEVAKYRDKEIVNIATDRNDFVHKVKDALKEKRTHDLVTKRQNIARENTWHVRATKMLEILKNHHG